MENNQIIRQSQNSKENEIIVAKNSLQVKDATEEEIKQALRYIFVLIGINQNNLPEGAAKIVLLNFIKERLPYTTLEEMKLAFTYAVEKKIDVDLNSYGQTFSPKTIMDVMTEYKKLKGKKIMEQKTEEPMINSVKAAGIIGLLSKETIDAIKEMGKPKDVAPKERLPVPDLHKELMNEFDAARKISSDSSGRFAIINGKHYTQDEYIKWKLTELNELQSKELTKKSKRNGNKF